MLKALYPAFLSLEDGTFYKGWSFFELFFQSGEIVFNTGMTGYQEVFSDPSYSGQIVLFTYPEIGNTGLNKVDNESNFIHIRGLVAKHISFLSNNWCSKISLKDYIILKRIPHIFGIDTRSLTKHLRLSGVMNAVVSNTVKKIDLINFKFNYIEQFNLVKKITSRSIYSINKNIFKSIKTIKIYKILVFDFGLKFNILQRLLSLGCEVYVVPATFHYQKILEYKPDGILLSNGPGNPLSALSSIWTIKKIITFANIPIFGICMGHQVLSLAFNLKTFKLKFGHRGLNHPSGFKNYANITSQNHGFVVNNNLLSSNNSLSAFLIYHFNLNDFTISSLYHNNYPFFSVQYHPEASPGPHDTAYLFLSFLKLIETIQLKK
uniref:Carbamoyl phosphate synthase small chain n=1 Tax=Harveyella mirabilis TaxID=282355 RepID=A0A3S8UW24_9FLOR|nr:carbamoyl phosphate synthase small subunit [Harveyella mirabilis]